jgi:hypothetical protein
VISVSQPDRLRLLFRPSLSAAIREAAGQADEGVIIMKEESGIEFLLWQSLDDYFARFIFKPSSPIYS